MKVSYSLMKLTTKEVLVNREHDFYSGPGTKRSETREETINTLEFIESFDTESDAISHLIKLKSSKGFYLSITGDYTILPIYSI